MTCASASDPAAPRDRAAIDGGRPIDWSLTSLDYTTHRPGPPQRLYELLAALGVGGAGQRVLDLGTGTGVVARELARRGAIASGVDIAAGQIAAARDAAAADGVDVDFVVAAAEACPFAGATFDAIVASQCWMYFDVERTVAEVRRLLRPGGALVTTHFSWLPRADAIARASEALVLRVNPAWQGADWSGRVAAEPAWAGGRARVRAMFWFDVDVPFTHESWRGRMRACRGVGAALTASEVEAFDAALAAWLRANVPSHFTVRHRVDAHVFDPTPASGVDASAGAGPA